MRRTICATALAALAAMAGCHQGPITIGSEGFGRRAEGAPGVTFTGTSYTLRDYPDSPTWIHGAPIVTGDFDNNGTVDVVVTITKTLTFVAGKGGGMLQPTPAVDTNGFSVWQVADFDEDGNLDLIGTQRIDYVGHYVALMRGHGDGTFGPVEQLTDGIHAPGQVALVDMNADGHGDLLYTRAAVYANVSTNLSQPDRGLTVRLGDGQGHFGDERTFDTGVLSPWQFAVADFNGDGHPDVALASATVSTEPSSIGLMLGSADGTFADSRQISDMRCLTIAAADLNGDANQDLVLDACGGGAMTLLGQGGGRFRQGPSTSVGSSALNVYVGDFDLDGRPDLVVPDAQIQMLYGVGDGSFSSAWSQASDAGFRSAAVADLNDDGRPDLLVTHPSNVSLDVYINTPDNSGTTVYQR